MSYLLSKAKGFRKRERGDKVLQDVGALSRL